jgi:hypothetical protein
MATCTGAVDFYKEAKKAGIKPIIGCEVYTALGAMSGKGAGNARALPITLPCWPRISPATTHWSQPGTWKASTTNPGDCPEPTGVMKVVGSMNLE